MSLAKDKYREETNEDCYCEQWQVEGGSYKDEYVLWLEQQLVNKLNLPVVSNFVRQELERRVDLILSEPDGIVRETMIKNIPFDL